VIASRGARAARVPLLGRHGRACPGHPDNHGTALVSLCVEAPQCPMTGVAGDKPGDDGRGLFVVPHIRRAHMRSPEVKAKITSADSASDQWMPIRLPSRPTDTPLKARKPRLAML
jgi:hypothetical protein